LTFGDKIELYLKQHNLTQKEFAAKAKINKTTLNNYIKGVSEPSFPIIKAIVECYEDLDARWLIVDNVQSYISNSLNHQFKENAEIYTNDSMREVTVYIEKECKLTGGACAFEMLPEIKAENEALKKEIAKLKSKG
jgi:transcriptional regulator with XRE-family HTH domain